MFLGTPLRIGGSPDWPGSPSCVGVKVPSNRRSSAGESLSRQETFAQLFGALNNKGR